MQRKIRALGLFSGGLDSQLAACVVRDQGIEVELVVFDSPFYNPESAIKAADKLGFKLHVVDFTEDIVGLVNNPPHGFGSHMNPCIDCHALMFRRAGEMMREMDFDFIFTGEVLNQRPMSQNRTSLGTVAKESTFEDLVLRPLCARFLEPTRPEREGWIDREKLPAFSGRSRKPQFELAAEFGIKEYPSPAGGCRLTEPGYSLRLKDLKEHEGIGDARALKLLRFGRHFRLKSGTKLILGRHAADNAEIEALAVAGDIMLKPELPGPTGLLPSGASREDRELAAAILVRYINCPPEQKVSVLLTDGTTDERIETVGLSPEEASELLVVKPQNRKG